MGQIKIQKIRKRNGAEQAFDINKVKNAIKKANMSVEEQYRLNEPTFNSVIKTLIGIFNRYSIIDVETVQDFVEKALMKYNCYEVAKSYVLYRDERKKRKLLTEDEEKIVAICHTQNEDVSGDNANKKPTQNNTMRDYIAGVECKAIARKILPREVVEAHDAGWLHYHDMDYAPVQPMHNCCLVNTFDMLTNGFQMGAAKIDSPHSFSTACNLMAQTALHISSTQYGGQTHSWAALAPFVDVTRQRAIEKYAKYTSLSEEERKLLVEQDVYEDVKKGVQTFQYQVITMSSANGQTPFLSTVLNLGEAMTAQERQDLALIIEEVLEQRKQGIKNDRGEWISPLFPKLLYFLNEGLNVNPDDPYYYLTKLAAECEVKRMQPDIISEKKCREAKSGQVIANMGCRSFLTPHWTEKIYYQNRGAAGCVDAELDSIKRFGLNVEFLDAPSENYLCKSITPLTLDAILKEILVHYDLPILQGSGCVKYIDIPAHLVVYNYLGNTGWIESIIWDKYVVTVKCREPKTYGRWNQGVVTINLPYIALEAKEKGVDFFKLLQERSELVRVALRTRHERVRQIRAENAPLLWMYGALSRLEAKDDLSSMLDDVEYTTISYGYVGLYETCMALIGESNTTAKGQELSKKILNFINDLLAEWKKEDHIPYSIYGTPEEQTTEKFAKALKRRFFEMGEVKGVTDHDYVTNSYHVNPAEKINAFDKLRIEGEFLQLSKGGAVSYVECSSDLDKNLAAVETLFRYMYDNILYSELNFTNEDYCDACGYHGELILDNTLNGKFLFHCPKCGCYDATKLHATRRLCGYLGEVANGISSSSPNANQGRLADIYARVKHI